MKVILAALAAAIAATTFAAPAKAFDGGPFDGPAIFDVRDGSWHDRDRDRGRGDWDGRRDRWEDRDDALSEGQIARRLMRQGFVRIEDIDRRRDRYIVRAVRPNGALVRLAVDAYDGEVIARERVGWVAGRRDRDRDRHPERDYRRPTNGVEFDLGGGTIGFYSR